MNFKSTLLKSFTLVILLAFAGNSYAQVFWSEDFASGIPVGWTNEDPSTWEALWTYCNPSAGTTGCSGTFGQGAFASTSAFNGFITVNSDAVGAELPADPHISTLTTTVIDCSAQSTVFARFEGQIGLYELPATGNALLLVSNNGTDWVEYNVYTGLDFVNAWSLNPEVSVLDISATAANQANVYLRIQWTANYEYFWNIDDLSLSSDDPTFPNDMRVNENFYAIAPNAQVPASQVEAFRFLADIENVGLEDQTNVQLTVTIVDDANPAVNLYDESLDYGTVMMDSLVENEPFLDLGFEPDASPASYTGTYTISADQIDDNLSNNTLTFDFEVTENVFAKEKGATRSVYPADSNWDEGELRSWAYGNHFYVTNGAGWWAHEASFGLGNAISNPNTVGKTLTLSLYKWNDVNGDGNLDTDQEEREKIGYNTYDILGTEAVTAIITLPLLDINTFEQGVSLMDNTDYVLMLEYFDTDMTPVWFAASEAYDYSAQVFLSQLDEKPRYAGMLGIDASLDAEPYSWVGFGRDIVPVVRMHITDQLVKTNELPVENKVSVFPSPAKDYIDVNLELTNVLEEITLQIVDVTGKTLESRQIAGVQNGLFRFEVSQLPAGSYFMNVNTVKGSRNVPFVVQR